MDVTESGYATGNSVVKLALNSYELPSQYCRRISKIDDKTAPDEFC
ncbi:MAG: hypothetical protein OXU40_08055 [Nitrospira sp.]|nr:hypothetical protein [Nitrospira sp.]